MTQNHGSGSDAVKKECLGHKERSTAQRMAEPDEGILLVLTLPIAQRMHHLQYDLAELPPAVIIS